jgi:hypothetical protein
MNTGGTSPTQRAAGILLGCNDGQRDDLIGNLAAPDLQSFWQAQ